MLETHTQHQRRGSFLIKENGETYNKHKTNIKVRPLHSLLRRGIVCPLEWGTVCLGGSSVAGIVYMNYFIIIDIKNTPSDKSKTTLKKNGQKAFSDNKHFVLLLQTCLSNLDINET